MTRVLRTTRIAGMLRMAKGARVRLELVRSYGRTCGRVGAHKRDQCLLATVHDRHDPVASSAFCAVCVAYHLHAVEETDFVPASYGTMWHWYECPPSGLAGAPVTWDY